MFSCLGKIFGCFGINGRATYRSKEQCPKNFGCSSKSESAGDSSILNPMKRSICHAERVENCERRSNFNFNYVELQQTGLSTKATNSGHGEDSAYFEGWHEYDRNPYDPLNNPSGVIQMGLAENQLSIDMLESWLKEHPEASISFNQNAGTSLFKELALYQDYHGLPAFKKAIASFMEAVRGNKVKFDPDNIVLTAGATAANELLMFCLADPGDAFLVPTPYYPGFARDLRWRTGVEIVPVHCESSNEFQITKCALETAYGEAQKQNLNVRGLIVTNPSNPLGTTLSAKALRNLLSFVQEKKIHLVCDEIYSGSVFSPPSFHSVAEILAKENHICDNVHIVYSLSKDLGLPGFRVGAIYSYNNTVVKTARRMSSFCMVSSQTQHMLSTLLSDSKFMSNFISENHKRLQERHRFLVSGLQKADIICLNSNAGLFCWVDMRHLLPSHDVKGELKLWKSILDEVGLNISPGSSFHCKEPGWFRVCFANMNQPTLQVSLERIQSFVKNNQSNKKLGTEGVCQCKALQCNMSPCAGTKTIRNKLIREQSSLDQMDQNESQS